MSFTLTLTDEQDSVTYTLLQSPFTTKDVTGTTDVTVLNGNVYTDYIYKKREWSQEWNWMDMADFNKLRGFYDRQFTLYKYPVMTLVEPDGTTITTPVVMDISAKKITSNCGTVENVKINLRETVQL